MDTGQYFFHLTDQRRARRRVFFSNLFWRLSIHVQEKGKRAFDLIAGSIALILLSPLIGLVALAVKLDSPGPVIFKQERVGKWGRRFSCYKFRSMYQDAEKRKAELLAQNEADQIVFKMKNDPRITRVGKLIRKLSLDELPQFVNVLQGHMSLVGPRPPVPFEVEQYAYEHFQRLDAIPGITGLQQVSGRSDLGFQRWVELDVEYIGTQSIRKDIVILLKTIPTVLSRKGAY